MECCICYENNNILTTKCNHHICISCIIKLRKIECPYCRKKLDSLPDFIKNKITNNNLEPVNNEPVNFGGGGFGVFWDAPGTPYGDLNESKKILLEKLKTIKYNIWKNIRDDINNNNKGDSYNEFFLRDLIDEILNNVH
jgi:hypothetical protein